jgi:hypothetical protein
VTKAVSGIFLGLVFYKFLGEYHSAPDFYTFSKFKRAGKTNPEEASLNQKANPSSPCGERLPEYA